MILRKYYPVTKLSLYGHHYIIGNTYKVEDKCFTWPLSNFPFKHKIIYFKSNGQEHQAGVCRYIVDMDIVLKT